MTRVEADDNLKTWFSNMAQDVQSMFIFVFWINRKIFHVLFSLISWALVFFFFFFFFFTLLLKKGFEFGDTMMAGNVAGRKIQNAIAALQDLERYEAIDTSLQIKQFLAETCDLLTQMVRHSTKQKEFAFLFFCFLALPYILVFSHAFFCLFSLLSFL